MKLIDIPAASDTHKVRCLDHIRTDQIDNELIAVDDKVVRIAVLLH